MSPVPDIRDRRIKRRRQNRNRPEHSRKEVIIMTDPRTARNAILGVSLVKRLNQRAFEAYYCATKEEALQQALALIPSTDVISWGGSATIGEIGLLDHVRSHFTCIDRDTAKTPEERVEVMRRGLLCDTFLMSANAITASGELVNIDGNGNRCAALIYGPGQVIVIVGLNKITKTLDSAIDRAHQTAAAINVQRFEARTPCRLTGICADCNCEDTICNYIVVTRRSKPANRIKVILVGEDLGF